MGFTKDTFQIPVERLTADGQGGFWALSYDKLPNAVDIQYLDQGQISYAGNLVGRDTFKQLMQGMIQNRVSLPSGNVKINLDDIVDRNRLMSQFQDPELTDSDCQIIAQNFDTVDLLLKLGLFPLVRRFYVLGLINLLQLGNILIGLGQQNKIDRQKAENVTQTLLDLGEITENQRTSFLQRWDNEVG